MSPAIRSNRCRVEGQWLRSSHLTGRARELGKAGEEGSRISSLQWGHSMLCGPRSVFKQHGICIPWAELNLSLWGSLPAAVPGEMVGECLFKALKDLRYLISRLAFRCLEDKQTLQVTGSSLDDLEVTLFLSALWLIQVSV